MGPYRCGARHGSCATARRTTGGPPRVGAGHQVVQPMVIRRPDQEELVGALVVVPDVLAGTVAILTSRWFGRSP